MVTLTPRPTGFSMATRPWLMVGALAGTDWLLLSLAAIASVYLRLWLGGSYPLALYWQLWPALLLFTLGFWLVGLYPGVGLSPVEELRRLCTTTTLTYLVLATAIFLFREGEVYSRGVFLLAWGFSLPLLLLGRAGLRAICSRQPWWGYPVLVLGAGRTGELVVRTLASRPSLGLRPVAVLDDDPTTWGDWQGMPVLGPLTAAYDLAKKQGIHHAIIAMPGVPRPRLLALLETYGQVFPHLLVIPDLFGMASLWVASRDLGGVLGLEVQQQLLLPGPRFTKRLIDLTATLLGGLAIAPLLLLLALLIPLDSPGPIFYHQTRIGQNGQPFRAWKFRTMVVGADQILATYLQAHPELEAAWQQDHKLKHDPRITRLGHLLRRASLDELPQLWNVLRGEMSLVGPRPIVSEEIPRYGDQFSLYTRVLPGLTGLWQVSGRNDVSYDQRVNLDAYYVRNWSVWLDIYILSRTLWAVIRSDGAY